MSHFLSYLIGSSLKDTRVDVQRSASQTDQKSLLFSESRTVVLCGPSGRGKSTAIRNMVKNHPNECFLISLGEHEKESYYNLWRVRIFRHINSRLSHRGINIFWTMFLSGLEEVSSEDEILEQLSDTDKKFILSEYSFWTKRFRSPGLLTLSDKILLERYSSAASGTFIELLYEIFGKGRDICIVDSLRDQKFAGGAAIKYGITVSLKEIIQYISSSSMGLLKILVVPIELEEEKRILKELTKAYAHMFIMADDRVMISTRVSGWKETYLDEPIISMDLLDLIESYIEEDEL